MAALLRDVVRRWVTGTCRVRLSVVLTHRNWFSPFPVTWARFLSKLRQLLLESQSQLDAAKSEAQKQSDELALVSERGEKRACARVWVCVCMRVRVCVRG